MIDRVERFEIHEEASTSLTFNGVVLSTRIMPAELAANGGDWCEVFVLSEHVVALSIGDVCGHGVEQYPAMVLIRQAVRDAARAGADPGEVLATANRFICALDPELHATALFALLDTKRGQLKFANAGHPPPLLVEPSRSAFFTYASNDLALGIDRALVPQIKIELVSPHSLLVLYTDGVTERQRDLIGGESELRSAAEVAYKFLAPPAASIIEQLLELSDCNHDDAAILTVSIPRQSSVNRVSEAGAAHPNSPRVPAIVHGVPRKRR